VLSAQRSGDLSLGTGGTVNDSPYVVVVGPGSDIVSQGDNGDWTQQSTRSGTSIATPIVAGNLALVLSKYEGATGNQAIQSLIRHTGGTPHELMWDPLYGYGLVVPDTLVAADPREYPDVNPLIDDPNTVDTLPRLPLAEEIFPEGNVSPSGNPTSDPGPPSDPGGAAGSAWMLVAVVGGLILLLLVIVIVVVAISASKKNKV
jgi:subtilisin family serine protease